MKQPTREPSTGEWFHGIVVVLLATAVILALMAGLWVLAFGPCSIWACAA